MSKFTTKQVRKIIHDAGYTFLVYTNKTKGDKSRNRRVKCYYEDVVFKALVDVLGVENVTITKGCQYRQSPGIVVKCIL